VDKVGHGWTPIKPAGQLLQPGNGRASRVKKKNKAVLLGSITVSTYLTVIEFLDAHSANWGWSWPDIGANFLGTSLFAGQEFFMG
jgi:hypothetical protein